MPEKKKKTRRVVVRGERRIDIVKFCAFWGIILSAILFIVSGICHFVGAGSTIVSVFDIIAKIALLVGVGFPAYSYARTKRRVWRIVFWVALVIYIVGCVFSII